MIQVKSYFLDVLCMHHEFYSIIANDKCLIKKIHSTKKYNK